MLHQQQQGGCDTIQAIESLEDILEETLRITEKILSKEPIPFPGLDSWNEEIEAENFYHTDKISDLYKNFHQTNAAFYKKPPGWQLSAQNT